MGTCSTHIFKKHNTVQGVEQPYIISKMRVRETRGCRMRFHPQYLVVTQPQAHPTQNWRSVLFFFNRWLVFICTKRRILVYSINHTLFLNNAIFKHDWYKLYYIHNSFPNLLGSPYQALSFLCNLLQKTCMYSTTFPVKVEKGDHLKILLYNIMSTEF